MKYKDALPLVSLIIIAGIMVLGCVDKAFNPSKNRYVIDLNLYDTRAEFQDACNAGYLVDACRVVKGNLHVIHSVKKKQCIWHELDHVFNNDFHGMMKATCEVLND